MNTNKRKNLLATFVAVFGAGAVSSGGVMAQDRDDTATNQRQLDEIIVTAQKREQSLQDVPLSVRVLGGEYMEKINLTNFQNLQFVVPGLRLDEIGPAASNFSLRGLPNARSFLGLEPIIDTYWNGAPITSSMALTKMFDLERVEVLRGPQGALQGRPAPGGVIQMHSRRPDVNQEMQFDGRIHSLISDDGDYQLEGGVSVSLIPDELAIRLSGLIDEDDGAADYVNIFGKKGSRNNEGLRLSVAWEPIEDFSALLVSQSVERRANDVVEYLVGNGSQGFIGPYSPNPRTFQEFNDFKVRNIQHNLNLELEALGHRFVSMTAYSLSKWEWDGDFDSDGSSIVLRGFFDDQRTERITQEFRIESVNSDTWEYMVGVYGLNSKFNRLWTFPLFNATSGPIENEQNQIGMFTFHKLQVTDRLALQGGFRLQYYDDLRSVNGIKNRDKAPTWSTQASYDIRDDVMGYVSYQRSYRPGGRVDPPALLGVSLPDLLAYPDETSDDIEVGVKATILDGRLNLNINLYRQEFDGLIGGTQAITVDSNLDGLFTRFQDGDNLAAFPISNDALAQGLEFEWQALLTDELTFSGSLAYNEVRYTGDGRIPCNLFDGIEIFPVGEHISTCDIGGKVDEVPPWSLSTTVEYTARDWLNWADWSIRGLYNFRDTRPTTLNTNVDDLGAFGVLNLYAGFKAKDDSWDISFWVENLTNKHAFTLISSSANFQTDYTLTNFVSERRFGLSATYNFSM